MHLLPEWFLQLTAAIAAGLPQQERAAFDGPVVRAIDVNPDVEPIRSPFAILLAQRALGRAGEANILVNEAIVQVIAWLRLGSPSEDQRKAVQRGIQDAIAQSPDDCVAAEFAQVGLMILRGQLARAASVAQTAGMTETQAQAADLLRLLQARQP